jgi:hypothetical protein
MRGIYAALVLIALASPLHAIEVEEHLWGFDGKAVPERFNVLSVLVSNPSPEPFQTALTLYRTVGAGGRVGAKLVRECFLSPHSSRWVQFHPYVRGEGERWTLQWGRGPKASAQVPQPTVGPPATVLLTDPDALFTRGRLLKAFPENLFPSSVAATDGLHALAMDRAPRWVPAQRAALRDWLHRGGIVHLLPGANGSHPVFTGELAVLNIRTDSLRVGSGRVVRHRDPAGKISLAALRHKGYDPPELTSGSGRMVGNLDDVFLYRLAELVRSRHNWPVIYLLTVIYMLLIFPGNLLVGRKYKTYWVPIAFFVGLVVVFGFVFDMVGRRGYGERTNVSTLSYARPLGGRSYDVSQWVNVFVTSGDYYTITHASTHNYYSTCQQVEPVNGLIRSGKAGAFLVDIPLYSKRTFLHRGRMQGHDTGMKTISWKGAAKLEELVLETGPDFPKEQVTAWALHAGTYYPMNVVKNRMVLSRRGPMDATRFFSEEVMDLYRYRYTRYRRYGRDADEVTPERVFPEMLRPLMARAVGGAETFHRRVVPPPPPNDVVQLFVFVKSPPGFSTAGKTFRNETGYTLYHIDLFRPEVDT